ncbi:MAG: hypothetical protein ACRENY_01230 [Candidatus Dormibacteria bacterium]
MLDAALVTTGAFTLGGAVVGFAGGTANQVVRGRQDRAVRGEARRERREDLRRQALIDFQQALSAYVQTVGRIHYSDVVAAKAEGVWGRPRRSPETELDLVEVARKARQRAAWIVDDDLRAEFAALDRQITVGIRRLASEGAASNFTARMSTLLKSTEERLGYLLRPLL